MQHEIVLLSPGTVTLESNPLESDVSQARVPSTNQHTRHMKAGH